jgi:hypothetical protein
MWILLTGYPITVGVMVRSGSQEFIAKFRPIISTEALWIIWTNHGTYWLILSALLVVSNYSILIKDPQAPGSQGQL